MSFSNEQLERYSRHIILKEVGVKGQKKLLNAKVLIIGAGGLGAPCAMYLAAAGELLTGYLLTFNALKMEFRKIKLPKPNGKCAVCGENPSITELIDYEQAECNGV